MSKLLPFLKIFSKVISFSILYKNFSPLACIVSGGIWVEKMFAAKRQSESLLMQQWKLVTIEKSNLVNMIEKVIHYVTLI